MDNFSATEQAYKNGYEKGRQDALKWIPVTERLPEGKGDVLVCDTREDFVATWEYLGNGLWLYDNIFWGTSDITHWMPLPDAPKGE